MKKEYITARLFRHNSTADGLITKEGLNDCDEQQSNEALNNSREDNKTVEPCANPNKSSLPQRLLSFIRRALALLDLD
jgi:hypothetical protein